MKIQLTKRDKTLLYALAIVLIVFGFLQLGIFPQLNRSTDLAAEIGELETQQLPMQAAVMGLPSVREAFAESEARLDETLADFYPYMENHEIGRLVTELLSDKYGLLISDLSMRDVPVGVAVPVYFAAQTGEEASASADGENIPVLSAPVSATATGARSRIQALIDDLFLNYPSLRVTGYTISESESGEAQLSLNLDLYMRTAE